MLWKDTPKPAGLFVELILAYAQALELAMAVTWAVLSSVQPQRRHLDYIYR